jgi:hypothetical protein
MFVHFLYRFFLLCSLFVFVNSLRIFFLFVQTCFYGRSVTEMRPPPFAVFCFPVVEDDFGFCHGRAAVYGRAAVLEMRSPLAGFCL